MDIDVVVLSDSLSGSDYANLDEIDGGSSNEERLDKNNNVTTKNFKGEIVWVTQSKAIWYPAIVLQEFKDKLRVGYLKQFNRADVPLKNIENFENSPHVQQSFEGFLKSKKGKRHTIAKNCNRDIESAKYLLKFPSSDRLKVFERIQKFFRNQNSRANPVDDVNDLIVNEYYDHMKKFDNQLQLQKHSKVDKSVSKPEPPAKRIRDRRLSVRIFMKNLLFKEESPRPQNQSVTEPKPKKQKIEPVQLTLKELFLPDHLDDDKDAVFRATDHKVVCCVCLKPNDLVRCIGCNNIIHRKCCQFSSPKEGLSSATYCSSYCQSCAVCRLEISEKSFSCGKSRCRLRYHQKCLSEVSKSSTSCLSHFCHTCYLKDAKKDGPIVLCIKCPMSYHADILCYPAGSVVVSKTQIICPQHVETNLKHINCNFCCYCFKDNKLLACNSCPRSFHQKCINFVPEHPLKCSECTAGHAPLFHSIVWAKLGNYPWWPAFVMIPWTVPMSVVKKQNDESNFCVRFMGTHDYCYVTSQRVFAYDACKSTPNKYSNKALGVAFSKALDEAQRLFGILENDEIALVDLTKEKIEKLYELNSSKGIYNSIKVNRPVLPVKLMKLQPDICNCKATDKEPCTLKNACINAILLTDCDENCPADQRCQNQKIRNRNNVELRILKTPNRGYGAFATQDIQPDTFIIEYIGEIIDTKEFNRRLNEKKSRGDKEYYFMKYQNKMYIDAEFYSNQGRFINHSCEPNCTTRKCNVDNIMRLCIFSIRTIKKNEEITFNYQMEFTKGNEMKCNCGSKKCTGVIGKYV